MTIDLMERRKQKALADLNALQADIIARSLMSMSRMSWAKELTGDEALRRAAQAFQKAGRVG